MVDFAVYIGIIRAKLESDVTLMALIDGMIYTSAPGMMPADDQLSGTNQACIGIRHGGLVSTTLGQVINHNEQLVTFVVTVQNIEGRDSDSYASSIINLIQKSLEGDIYQDMNNITYHVMFKPPFKVLTVFDPAFPNRANASLTATAFYIDSST